ncbi:alanine racemase [Microlunatus soli]|uniref:D-serine deaminase, pyridoxal phosphate-dependent n=1 Tax=Microlunatus soli TaxID=630515 RepID=A0A1H1T668_9ACTN|nr:alanine racemase [Microlunatus soli]SDS55690.1 D-serine deaminase, pyridoxal phosphate-dependent [Microlunatus soli]
MSHLDALRDNLITLDLRDKNWSPALAAAPGPAEVDVPLAEVSTPVFTLDLDLVAGNLTAMQRWVDDHGASLAPHGKTTMCPALWQWQLAQGSWAITVANEPQLRVARDAGIGRVVVANEYLSPVGLRWLAGELDADPDFEVTTWVDSVAGVEQMTGLLEAAGARRQLPVCVEIGHPHARAGVREHDDALTIARAVVDSPRLLLRGVAGYEGSVPGDSPQTRVDAVKVFLAAMADRFTAIAPLVETDDAILTAGGSAHFDLVAEILGPVAERTPNGRLLLRSGAYIVHDDGMYAGLTPAATRTGPELQAAAHVWARVVSAPEPHLILLDAGKRDLPYDAGLPTIQQVLTAGGLAPAPAATIVNTNDQHAYVELSEPGSLKVGDVVRLGLSHPCTMFDKWRSVLLVEGAEPRIRGAVATYF